MNNFLELCEEMCGRKGLALSPSEIEQIEEMECEGLMPSQAPEFIRRIRETSGDTP